MNNSKRFKQLDVIIEADYANMKGISISRSGHRLYKKYLNGCDEMTSIHIASATKSIMSILLGIAIDKGYITGVDEFVLDYFPDYVKKRGETTIDSIRIENLLTMTAPYKYKSEPYTKVYSSNDWTKAALDLLGGKGQVGTFKYTTVGCHILSGILQKATGMTVLDFASKYLFEPLYIDLPSPLILNTKDLYMSFIKGSTSSNWVVDPSGVNTGGWGLTLTLDDMTKIGQLYLDKGKWNGFQIVSSEWIHVSTSEHIEEHGRPYGYLWWVIKDGIYPAYAAIGDGGNVIYICPSMELVITITSSFKPRAKDRIQLIKEYILPCI